MWMGMWGSGCGARDVALGVPWFGPGAGEGRWEPSAAGLGRGCSAGRVRGVGRGLSRALGDILLLAEEEMQPPRPSRPPAKPAVITAQRLCCWQNE